MGGPCLFVGHLDGDGGGGEDSIINEIPLDDRMELSAGAGGKTGGWWRGDLG